MRERERERERETLEKRCDDKLCLEEEKGEGMLCVRVSE